MQLVKAELVNICQHQRLEVEFPPGGLTAIVGPNGSGKTNLTLALLASLTGDFRCFPRSKTDNICRQSNEEARSYIRTQWLHNQTPVEIVRSLRPASSRLVYGDEEPLRKSGEVTKKALELFGADAHKLLTYVFVRQWKVFDFLSADPGDRIKSLAKLFGVEKAEEVWTALGDQIRIDRPLSSRDEEAVDRAKRRLASAEFQLKEQQAEVERLEETREEAEQLPQLETELRELEDVLRRQRLLRGLHKETETLKQDLERKRPELEQAKTQGEERQAGLRDLEQQLSMMKEHQRQLRDWEKRKERWDKAQRVLGEPEPVEPRVDGEVPEGLPASLAELQKLEATTEAKWDQCERALSGLVGGELPTCPTCGEPSERWAGRVEEWRSERNRCSGLLHSLRLGILHVQKQERAMLSWRTDCDRWEMAQEQAREQLKEIGNLGPRPEASEEDFSRIRAEEATARRACEEAQRTSERLQQEISRGEGRLEAMLSQAAELICPRVRDKGISQQADELRKRIVRLGEVRSNLKAAERVLQERQRQRNALSQELEEAQAQQSRAALASKWVGDMESLRSLFHRDNLPRRLLGRALAATVDRANEFLEELQSPFFMHVAEDLQFWARKQDGSQETAAGLSGGEQVLFALAFRLAVNSLFSGETGLLALDEPTAGLDDENLRSVANLFRQLSDTAKRRGLQVLVVTHDVRFDAFDHVIELGRNSLD